MTKPVVIHTDGACRGNPGPGGWGALLRFKGTERELYGYEPEEPVGERWELLYRDEDTDATVMDRHAAGYTDEEIRAVAKHIADLD